MLSRKQLSLPLIFYHIASKIGLVPFIIDWRTATIQLQVSKKLRMLWWCWMTLAIMRGVLGVFLFLLSYHYGIDTTELEDFPIALFTPYACFMGCYVYYHLGELNREVTVLAFNESRDGINESKPLLRLTLQEQIVMGGPVHAFIISGFYTFRLFVKPYASYNPFSVLSPAWQNGWTFAAVISSEFLIATSLSIFLMFGFQILLLFFQKCMEEMKFCMKLIEKADSSRGLFCSLLLMQSIARMRKLQLLIQTYSQAFCFVHFFIKIFALATFILITSFGILLKTSSALLATEYTLLGVETAVLYCLSFHKAFAIPLAMTNFKRRVSYSVRSRVVNSTTKKILFAQVRSLPLVGLKVGQFHVFERMSTPNFVAFGSKNIVRVLIAFENP